MVSLLYGLSVPTPLAILLMTAGGMARQGHLPWMGLWLGCPLGIVVGEQFWYWVGRAMGLSLLHRIPFTTPDRINFWSLRFRQVGPRLLLTGRFVPGMPAFLVPLAGMTGIPWRRFVVWDAASSLLFCTVYSTAGAALAQWLSPGQIALVALTLLALTHLMSSRSGRASGAGGSLPPEGEALPHASA